MSERPKVGSTVRVTNHRSNEPGYVGRYGTLVEDDESGLPYRVRTVDGDFLWAVDVEEQTLVDPVPEGRQIDINDLWEKVMAALIDESAAPEVVVAVARVFRENT